MICEEKPKLKVLLAAANTRSGFICLQVVVFVSRVREASGLSAEHVVRARRRVDISG